ncbi:MAG: hypothetical protein L3J56_08455 [Bacteroidales bacterium]|nr:hypothetical protein [Bacteroidales bacterium]
MKTVFYILISSILFFSFKPKENKITAQLANIEYYSKGICKDTSLIYVRVLYKVRGEKIGHLKMKHDFQNGITSTMPVTEKDKKGNCVYGFCIGRGEIKEFTTIFIASDGKTSNKLYVKINVPNADIISGTAPETYRYKN